MARASHVLWAFGALLAFAVAPALGQTPPHIACPPGNLLEGLKPTGSFHTRGGLSRLLDVTVAPEGARWNSSSAVILQSSAASIDYDLGAPVGITAVFVQADADDSYSIYGSIDGKSYERLATVESVVAGRGHGLRSRSGVFPMQQARYLRFGEPSGDGSYGVTELQLYCRTPSRFPPSLEVAIADPEPARDWWNDAASGRWQLALALLAMALVLLGVGERWYRVLAVVALATYVNFGAFHFYAYIHAWDVFHYYVGSKYFAELSYTHLYDCVAVAEAEDGLRYWVERRRLTDLRTNVVVGASSALSNVARCKAPFSPERWGEFKADVAFFRGRETPSRWEEIQIDHGFNGTPVWLALGSALANLAPASERSVLFLTLLDPAYLVAAAWLLVRAFGWRTAAIALTVFATGAPERFLWTGGAFLRWDWLFYTVAAVALLKLERPFLAGLALGYAISLRIFPGFAVVGPMLAFVHSLATSRQIDRAHVRLFAGTAVSVAVLVLVSLPLVGGVATYEAFVRNSQKHTRTALNNNIGLPTVVAFRPSQTTSSMRDGSSADPWRRWRETRARAFADARPVYWLIVAGYLCALALAARGQPPWVAAALGLTFIAVAVELTGYYYAFLLAVAVLAERRDRIAVALLACTAATQVIDWAPFAFMPTATDEKCFAMSLVILLTFALIVVCQLQRSPRAP